MDNLDFGEFLSVLDEDEFQERPVSIEEFATSPDFCNLKGLSEYQYEIVRASTQIFRKETLIRLHGQTEGERRWRATCNEVIMQLGKGSGKDFTSTVACAYIVYLLLCLRDPAGYFDKPDGDAIDILNVAVNSEQAKNVFFKGFVNRLEKCAWFVGKYETTANAVRFPKNITVHSGHSQRESWEGYNFILVILDEISGFQMESTSGNDQAKTAQAIYDMYRASVDSRFSLGKVLLLSFPRFKGDFITQRYDEVVNEKKVVIREHTYVIHEDLDPNDPDNQFTIKWEEDHIISYNEPKVFALKRPSWEVNPGKDIEDYKGAFMRNYIDALSRFACMPPEAIDAFFKSREKVETAFCRLPLAVDEAGVFHPGFKPVDDDTLYFIHVDLAEKHDRCAVGLAHVAEWVHVNYTGIDSVQPVVHVDAVRYWTPTSDKTVEFDEVRDYILDLKRRGFRIVKATFDRWNSHQIMLELEQYGIATELLSVAKKHYDDFKIAVNEERVKGPGIKLLVDEMMKLQIIRDKVDHPRKGGKDLSDATCGAVFDAIYNTPKEYGMDLRVHTFRSTAKAEREREVAEARKNDPREGEIIDLKREMPENLQRYFAI